MNFPNLSYFKHGAQFAFSRTLLHGTKYSPQLLLGAGILGGLGAIYYTYKATRDLPKVQTEAQLRIDQVHEHRKTTDEQCYPLAVYKKDLVMVHTLKWAAFAKLYAPAVSLGLLSTAAVLASHGILNRRYGALAAAYGTLQKGFTMYRQNVIAELGAAKDDEFRFGKPYSLVETQVVAADGSSFLVEERVPNKPGASMYAVWFDEASPQYRNDPFNNRFFLERIESFANDKLRKQGHLFLNELLDDLALPRVPDGQAVGWIINHPDPKVDQFVDLGLKKPWNRDFVDGATDKAYLDFNVQGSIWEMI